MKIKNALDFPVCLCYTLCRLHIFFILIAKVDMNMNIFTLQERLDAMAEKDLHEGLVTCAGMQVVLGGKTIYQANHGYADGGKTIPLNSAHLFRMASMTKPVTATCILQLVENGKLNLEDPVEQYLPSFRKMQVAEVSSDGTLTGTHPSPRPFTIHDLLTHSSGLGSGAYFARFCKNPGFATGDTLSSKIDDWADSLLEFDPGTRFSYSGLVGFDVLAHLVELCTDMPYEDYAKANLFAPLSMTDTCFTPTAEQWERLVQMHETIEGGKTRPVNMEGRVFGSCPTTYHSGGAGLVSSLTDYTRFARMLLKEGTLDGVQILHSETVKEMHSRQLPPLVPGTDATYSWGLSMRVALADHGSQAPLPKGAYGWSGAYGTHFWCDPAADLCAVYVSNMTTAGGSGALTARHFENVVYEE